MYLLFRHHHIMPIQYYKMGYGERQVVRAFMHQQIDDINEEIKKSKEG